MQRVAVVLTIMGLLCAAGASSAAVSDLRAEYRNGQVFLTWKEASVKAGTTFTVCLSDRPIAAANLASARKVCENIGPRSAEDWWLNPYAYGRAPKPDKKTGKPPVYTPQGFLIEEGGKRLDPASGLHVHTVAEDEVGRRYYAVTTSGGSVKLGENSLREPVRQKVEPIQPVWQDAPPKEPKPGAGKGKAALLALHAKGNRRATQYLVFGDKTHCWREGVPFKFDLSIGRGLVTLSPSDTMYVGHPFKNARDGRNRGKIATFTFWYGCNDKVYDAKQRKKGVATDYTQRRLLWLVDWAKRYLKIDPDRFYCRGGSMGGCGGMAFTFRHPEIFAALYAMVPIVTYSTGDPKKGRALGWHSSEFRVAGVCGPLSMKCSEGMTLGERLDARRFVLSHPGDLPYLVICNGRKDGSIPWHVNPAFYRAMRKTRHGFLAAWNDGIHSRVQRGLPADVKRAASTGALMRFALNKSYPVFSNSSADNDPGNGDSNNGDIVGFMNRGLDWTDPKETPRRYEVLVKWTQDPKALPVTVDVTPRRVQAFKLKPGETCAAINLDAAGKTLQTTKITADKHGLFTFPAFRVTSAKGNRMVLTR